MSRPARRAGPTSLLNFRVSAEERADLEARAARDGVSISAAVRQAVFGVGEAHPSGAIPRAERLTAGLGSTEDARLLEALAGRLGVLPGDLLRQLLEREHAAHDFVDARPGPAAVGEVTRAYPRHVFTLHRVPGRAEPLCVRRRVLDADRHWIGVEVARARRTSVCTEDLLADGFAVTRGSHDGDSDARTIGGLAFYDLEPRVTVFRDVPTGEQRRAWATAREQDQALLGRARAGAGLWVWRLEVITTGHADPAVCVGKFWARVPDEWIGRRGDLHVGDDGPEQYPDAVNLFDLAREGRCESVRHVFIGRSEEGGYRFAPDRRVLYRLDEPTWDVLQAEGRSEWAHGERIRRIEEHFQERRRARDAGGPIPPTLDVSEALRRLGLTWPCTEAQVRQAQRRAAAERHPDRGGDHDAFVRTNADAEAVISWLRRAAA